uniref:Uncharacterized protein n=1 Tax=Rhipicephalus pulchellus TaxID=72859 RepID=L7M240_RHIPC
MRCLFRSSVLSIAFVLVALLHSFCCCPQRLSIHFRVHSLVLFYIFLCLCNFSYILILSYPLFQCPLVITFSSEALQSSSFESKWLTTLFCDNCGS